MSCARGVWQQCQSGNEGTILTLISMRGPIVPRLLVGIRILLNNRSVRIQLCLAGFLVLDRQEGQRHWLLPN